MLTFRTRKRDPFETPWGNFAVIAGGFQLAASLFSTVHYPAPASPVIRRQAGQTLPKLATLRLRPNYATTSLQVVGSELPTVCRLGM